MIQDNLTIEEKRIFYKKMNLSIDKTFSENADVRAVGRRELEQLRGKESNVPYFIAGSYEVEYYRKNNPSYAQKAIDEYENFIGSDPSLSSDPFLKRTVQILRDEIEGKGKNKI